MKIFKERSMPNDEEEVEEEEEEDELGNNPNHDYFLNYYKHGIDMLIDGKTHTLKKLILHTNFPGHDDFSLYRKCQFQLEVPTETELKRLDDEENVSFSFFFSFFFFFFFFFSFDFLSFSKETKSITFFFLKRKWKVSETAEKNHK